MKLYPPIIKGTIPAFSGNIIEVPFEMNRSVSKTDVKEFKLKIKTVQSNRLLADLTSVSWNPAEDDNVAKFNIDRLKLNIGQFYKIQIAYVGWDNIIGYYSTVGVIKYTSEPIVEILDSSDGRIFNGKYSQKKINEEDEKDYTEKLYSYNFSLFDHLNNLIETSGDLLHNSSKDTDLYESFDSYTLKKELEPNQTYYLKYSIKTINGLEREADFKRVVRAVSIDSKLRTVVKCKMNQEEGYIDISLVKPEEDIVEQPAVGSFYLLRASSEDNFTSWSEVLKFVLYGQQPSRHLWKDMTVKQGVTYKYAVQQFNSEELRTNKIESNEVFVDFEHAFLYDGNRQLKIKYNPKVSSFKNTILESKVETIGSKHPFIFRNGSVNYKEFPISGLISYLSDENKLFFNTETDIFYDVNLTSQNIHLERQFKLEVLDWLNDGKPKLFRSPSEGNYIVRLMNVSLSPTDSVGRMLHTFTCIAYEIAENIYDNLKLYDFVKVNDPTTPQLRWLSVDLSAEKDFSKNLLKYDASSIRLEGLIPGEKLTIKMNADEPSTDIVIGATGSYTIDLKNNVVITELKYKGQDSMTAPHQGVLTYSYYSTNFKDSFDTVKELRINRVPCRQFIGEYNNIIDELNNYKERLGAIGYVRFKLRDAEKIAYCKYTNDYSGKIYYYSDDQLTDESLLDLKDFIDIYKVYTHSTIKNNKRVWDMNYYTWYDGYNDKDLGKEYNDNYSKIIINEDENNKIDLKDTLYFEIKNPKDIYSIKTGAAIICEICYQSTIITYDLESEIDKNTYTTALQELRDAQKDSSTSRTVLKEKEEKCREAWNEYCEEVEKAVSDAERR